MSRTDKDVPYWVHTLRNGRERHDHRFGVCDFAPAPRERERLELRGWRYRYSCGLELADGHSYARSLKYYSRTKLVGWYAREFYDRDSARIRKETNNIKKLYRAGEDIEFEDVWNRPHRHSAEWEAW